MTEMNSNCLVIVFYYEDVSDELSEEVLNTMLSKTGQVNLGTNEQLSPLAYLNRLR